MSFLKSHVHLPILWKRAKDTLVYQIVRGFGWCCRHLPKPWAMRLGSGIGKLLYRLLKKRRQIACNNLHIAFGNAACPIDIKVLTDLCRTGDFSTQLREICKASFVNLGKTCIEFLRFPQFDAENIWREVTVEGAAHLHTALAQGKGAIVFLPHFGNWELLSLVYGALIPNQAKAIAFPLKKCEVERLYLEISSAPQSGINSTETRCAGNFARAQEELRCRVLRRSERRTRRRVR